MTFSVAVVEMSEGTILSDRFNSEGWWRVTSGDCKVVFNKAYLDISTAFLAFSYIDRFGTAGIAQVNPSPDTDEFLSSYQSNFRASTRFFCGTHALYREVRP